MSHPNCTCVACECLMSSENIDAFIGTMIKKKGFAIVPVVDPNTPNFIPFHYTIGLTETFKSPEVIITGYFDSGLINVIVTGIAERLKIKSKLLDTEEIEHISQIKLADGNMKFVNLGCRVARDEFKEMCCGRLINRYGKDGFQLRQVILPDKQGKLPWHTGFDVYWLKKYSQQISLYDPTIHINLVKECHSCYVRDVHLSKCSGCMKIRYCGATCQKTDWKTHKPQCKQNNK